MPYKFKGKRNCTQSDGSKGKYQTVKKDGSKRCYKSEKQYKAAQAYAHEDDHNEEDTLREYVRFFLRESRFKQMSKSKFTELRQALANSSFLDADPEGDLDDEDWSSEAAKVLRDDLNDYFDSKFEPGYITCIVKVDMMGEMSTPSKDDVLKGATYYFDGGLHFIEMMLMSIDDGSSIGNIKGASQKVYEVLMHELLHMQQFLKFSKGDPTDEKWVQFMSEYEGRGGSTGMGEDYFFFDQPDGASELETFSFQMANELVDALGKDAAIKALVSKDRKIIQQSSASYRDIENRSNIDRPEIIDMFKRAKQYAKRM